MKDFYNEFSKNVLEYRKGFVKKHKLFFGMGAFTTLLGIGAGALFNTLIPASIAAEITCFTLGTISGTLTSFVATNGIRNSKKLKELSTANPENAVSLINKYSSDENKNVRNFAHVLKEKYDTDGAIEQMNINPFEGDFDQPKIPEDALDDRVQEAMDKANNANYDIDV